MKNLKLDMSNGNILIDEIKIAPLTSNELTAIIKQHKQLDIREIHPAKEWTTFTLGANIAACEFGLNISYDKLNLHSCWLSWNGGISKTKGYDTTESELISDKNTLTKFMTKIIGKQPEEKNYNHDVFLFDWGYISTSASLQSAIVTIGISWSPH